MLLRRVRTGRWTSFEGKHSYGALLRSSKFGLAPGGHAPTSYRFSEMLVAGVVPVVPDNGEVRSPPPQPGLAVFHLTPPRLASVRLGSSHPTTSPRSTLTDTAPV